MTSRTTRTTRTTRRPTATPAGTTDVRPASAAEPSTSAAAVGSAASTVAKPLRADAQRNLERILAATRELAAENPDEIVMERVAERAGVGIGTLYRRFPTRLALLETAYADEATLLIARAKELGEQVSPIDALSMWGHEVARYAATKKALLRAQQDADAAPSTTMSTYRDQLSAAARGLLVRAQQAGQARSDVDPSDVLRLLVGCAMMTSDDPGQRDRLIRIAIDGLRT